MAEKSETNKPKRLYIDVDDPEDVFYWTNRFSITGKRLREIIETVGNRAPDVANVLGRPYPPD